MTKRFRACFLEKKLEKTSAQSLFHFLGYPSLPQIVALKQHKFFCDIQLERSYMSDDPLNFAINLVRNDNTATSRLIRRYTTTNARDPQIDREEIISSLVNSDSSRRKTYVEINPSFVIPSVYKTQVVENIPTLFIKSIRFSKSQEIRFLRLKNQICRFHIQICFI